MLLLDRPRQQQFGSNWPLYIEGFQRYHHKAVVANQTDDILQTLASELLNDLRVEENWLGFDEATFTFSK